MSFTSLRRILSEIPAKFNSTFRHSSRDSNPSLFSEPFYLGNSFVTSLKFETLASENHDISTQARIYHPSASVNSPFVEDELTIKIDFFAEWLIKLLYFAQAIHNILWSVPRGHLTASTLIKYCSNIPMSSISSKKSRIFSMSILL